MKQLLILAWRNIWRNKRRTLITISSIFFALFLAIVMRSFQIGSYDHMVKNIVGSYTGYIQIQHKDYWNDKTIDNTFVSNSVLVDALESTKNISVFVHRLESYALASSGEKTKGVLVMGIDIDKENELSKIESRLVKYKITDKNIDKCASLLPESIKSKLFEIKNKGYSNSGKMEIDLDLDEEQISQYLPNILANCSFYNKYFSKDDDGVIIGDRLANFLNLSVNDTLILLGQGYHGYSAAGKYPIRGIVKIPIPDLDNMLIYLPLENCQTLYSSENRLTSIPVNLIKNDTKSLEKTEKELQTKLANTDYIVKNWKKLNPELVQQIESDNISGLIMIAILYMVVAFGVFGTVLMMTSERKKEFGVMVAVGMKKRKLALIVSLEMILLGFFSIILGSLASIPLIQYFLYNPIKITGDLAKSIENFGIEAVMPFAWKLDVFLNQTLIIIILVILSISYPIYTITKINVIKALKA